MSLKKELSDAIEIARGAGRIVLEHFGRVERLTKRKGEAVTAADRASQRYIAEQIHERYPADGFIGEENEDGSAITFNRPRTGQRVWVIDPIDGTNNFIAGFGAFAVCIGLLEEGQPVLGVVYDVCRNRIYSAAKGQGAYLDERRILVPPTAMNDSALLMLTANLLKPDGSLPGYAGRWLGQTKWKVRILGSAALEVVTVAAGIAHAAVTVHGKLWDIAAPAAIVLEAGGVLTDLAGKPIFPFDLTHYDGAKVPFLAAAPKAHAALLEEIRNYP